jgi:hypothetical protein
MKVLKVYGALRKHLGGRCRFEFEVDTPAQALKALCVNFPGLDKWFMDREAEGTGFRVTVGRDKITTGASGDMRRVYEIARMMVTQYGFSDRVGTVVWSQTMTSPEMDAVVDQEIARIAKEAYAKALALVRANQGALVKIAEALLEKETLTGEEVTHVMLMP